MMMRCMLVLCAVVALFLGCKGSSDSSGPTRASEEQSSPGPGGEERASGVVLIRAGDDSAAGRALTALVAVELPDLTATPGCSKYGEQIGPFSASLARELGALRGRDDTGARADDLARLGAWLEDRVKVFEQVAPSQAVHMDELVLLHQELTAALFDLGDSLSAAFGSSGRGGDDAAARVENAARNVAATVAALESLCARS